MGELIPPASISCACQTRILSLGLLEDDGHSLGRISKLLEGESNLENECWKIFFTAITQTLLSIIQE